jgi:hypothetical protein
LEQSHAFCNNANAAIRREVYQTLPYNEELTGLEDLDWATRAQGVGHNVAYVAEAPVAHIHRESFSQTKHRYQREAIAYRCIFPDHGMGLSEATRLALSNIARDYLHAAGEGELIRNVLDIPRFRIAQFWGGYTGFRRKGRVSETLLRHFYYPAEGHRSAECVSHAGRRIQYEEIR